MKATQLWASDKSLPLRTVSAISLIVLGVVAVLSAQSGSNTATSTNSELLAEVRGLRADLVKAAHDSGRIQLLSARLSIEEQRLQRIESTTDRGTR